MKNKNSENKVVQGGVHSHAARIVVLGCAMLLLAASVLHPVTAGALGLRVPNQDATAIARGNADAATADNPSAIYYNPAGITQLPGTNAQVGVYALSANSTYEAANGTTSHSKFAVQEVPEIYLTASMKDQPFSFGLGVFAPYGLALQWSGDAPFRTAGYNGSLTYVTVAPVIAAKVSDKFSIAIGPTFNYSQVLLEQGITPTSSFKFRGQGSAVGVTGGVRWQPCDEWSFGVKYHSPTSVSFGGNASTSGLGLGNSHASVAIPFPQFATAGVSYRPNTNWNFETDVDFTDWHSLDTIYFNNTPLGTIPKTFKWKGTYMFEVGATRYLENGYYVSAGYFYSPNSTSQQYFTPLVPDTNLHVGSLGVGHKGMRWAWALAAQIITGPDRIVTGDIDPSADGSYHWLNASLALSVGYHF